MAIKVVLFDLDNTLIDRQKMFRQMLMNKIGEYHNGNVEEIVDEIIDWDNKGNQNRLEVFKKYVNKYQPNVSADELNAYWDDNSGKIVCIYEDAYETLSYLKDKYRLGIVSNGNSVSQRRKVNQLPFLDLFELTIISGEFGINKPDVRIFDHVAKEMGVKNSECAFVGDNFRCDIEGATNAGMLPIWRCSKEQFDNRYICIEELSELKKYL